MQPTLNSTIRYFLSLILIETVILSFTKASLSQADEVYTFIVQKQEEKAKSRWSLSEWLKTKEQMRLMDLWLYIHSPSPYEFFIQGESIYGNVQPGAKYTGWRGAFAAYASIIGLQIEREATPVMRATGLVNLRVFGVHAQNTNITGQFGFRQSYIGKLYRSSFFGGTTTLYLTRFFGIEGLYRHYFGQVGNRLEGIGFIDFKALRVFGTYFSETEKQLPNHPELNQKNTGFSIGGRFFF